MFMKNSRELGDLSNIERVLEATNNCDKNGIRRV
jgi:hypothetical protein